MPVVNVKHLHERTGAVLNEVSKGQCFDIEKHGQIIATLRPAQGSERATWAEVLAPVRGLHKKVKGKTPNPVLAERDRRRR